MLFRRAAAFLPAVLFVACSFPDYQFDDKRFNAQNGGAGEGGSDAEGGSSGKGGKGGSGAKGGEAGNGGDAGNGEGGDAGTGGTGGTGGGGTGGASGSDAGSGGNGGSDAGAGGSSGTGGMAGSSAGAAGASGSTGGGGAGTAGASGKGGAGPAGTCKTAADCKASERCSEPTTIGAEQYFKCFPKNPDAGAGKPGTVCDDGSDCDSFVCLMTAGSTKGVCSGTCGTDADCATGSVCFEDFLSQNSTVRLCSVKCLSDAGCDPGLKMSCSIYEDPISETVAFACQRTGGTGFGVEPPPGEGCASGVVIDKKCTKPCESPAECAAPFPACKSGPIGTASGGTAVIKVCTTQ